ncbi:hypothetical protein H5410_008957 [Solanum commersonii]|uniref:Uncharacterized protein n=1 Tax=Solanum commersonii TaxID=4109 RepID=A0A9J6AHC5_SOLCO|nr:hypothetical protein H5410_008957 [Solanum commersonii]
MKKELGSANDLSREIKKTLPRDNLLLFSNPCQVDFWMSIYVFFGYMIVIPLPEFLLKFSWHSYKNYSSMPGKLHTISLLRILPIAGASCTGLPFFLIA